MIPKSNLNIINIHYSTMGFAYNKNECMYADGKMQYKRIMKCFTSGSIELQDIVNNKSSYPDLYEILELLRKVYQCYYDPYESDEDAELWDHIRNTTNLDLEIENPELTVFLDIYEGKMFIDLLMRECSVVDIGASDIVELCRKRCVDDDPASQYSWTELRDHVFDRFRININSDRIIGNIALYLCNRGVNLVF